MTDSASVSADGSERLRALVARLAAQLGPDAETLETHISIVLLAGEQAWKFKKPVSLGFLDFSTLALRKQYCDRELALNRRYAPDIYDAVVAVGGNDEKPVFGSAGEAIEYAVRMRRFPDAARLDKLLEAGALNREMLAELGDSIGRLYRDAPAAKDAEFGAPALVGEQILETLSPFARPPHIIELEKRLNERIAAQRDLLQARWRNGWIRDCHGDLHLSNLVQGEGGIHPFDCIEFSDELRFIDPMSDIAFLLMDLDMRGQPRFANVFLNAYLAAIGDYDGLPLLPLYLAYRSLVRAKVAELQRGGANDAALAARVRAHLEMAARYLAGDGAPALAITHGVSGSGKSWLAAQLAEFGFIHCRSDIERKRLAGLEAGAASGSALGAGLYQPAATEATYERLLAIARAALGGGYSVLIDATFLDAGRRAAFREAAAALGCGFHILDCDAPEPVLRERIRARAAGGGDASEADIEVLEYQLKTREPLGDDERRMAVAAPPEADTASLAARLGAGRPGLSRG